MAYQSARERAGTPGSLNVAGVRAALHNLATAHSRASSFCVCPRVPWIMRVEGSTLSCNFFFAYL